jgi:hypothetical protein
VNSGGKILRSFEHPVTTNSFFYPLDEIYEEIGQPLPEASQVAPSEIPEPYRGLLVHNRDMTPTLEAAYGSKLHLRVLRYAASDHIVTRLVVLVLDNDEKAAVSMGAIRIFLHHLPPAARDSVLGRREPFGAILQRNQVTHRSHPVAYFKVRPDSMIADALGVQGSPILYGRRNTIWNSGGDPLAEVVEILPPSQSNF